MKKILFILLLTIPFIGCGQKQIEKKIQTKNGTIILYNDISDEPCTTGDRTLIYKTENKEYSYKLGFDMWFGVDYLNNENNSTDKIIIFKCNTNCNICWSSIIILSVENESLTEIFSSQYDDFQISEKNLVISNSIRTPEDGYSKFIPHRFKISTYSYVNGKFKKVKEVVTLDKFKNFNLEDLEETKIIRIE